MKSFNAISFQCLFGLYPVVRVDSLSRGFRGLNSDVFMLFGCLASVGSYGLTARGCCGMLFNSYADSNQRSTRYRLKWLCDAGYIVKFSYKGRVRYRLDRKSVV